MVVEVVEVVVVVVVVAGLGFGFFFVPTRITVGCDRYDEDHVSSERSFPLAA